MKYFGNITYQIILWKNLKYYCFKNSNLIHYTRFWNRISLIEVIYFNFILNKGQYRILSWHQSQKLKPKNHTTTTTWHHTAMMANDETKTIEPSSMKGLAIVSPYYLHPFDNPDSLISLVQLKGDNYEEWARAMRNVLWVKKKLGFINGASQNPEMTLSILKIGRW